MNTQDIINLIDLALIDGKLDEAERKMLYQMAKSIGIDSASLASMIESRQQMLSGEGLVRPAMKKCPSCQAVVEKEMMLTCEYCGASLSTTLSSQKVDEFHSRLMEMSSDRRHEMIKSYPLPTEKNEILAFLSLSTPLALESYRFLPDVLALVGQDEKHRILERHAWVTKTQSLVTNSRVVYATDAPMQAVLDGYTGQLEKARQHQKRMRLVLSAVAMSALVLISVNPTDYLDGHYVGEVFVWECDILGGLQSTLVGILNSLLFPLAALLLYVVVKRFRGRAYIPVLVGLVVIYFISEEFRDYFRFFWRELPIGALLFGFLSWLIYRGVTSKSNMKT